MANFLTRLVERMLGNITPVKPLIVSRFAPGLTMLSDDHLNLQSEPESNDELEGILSISPWETLSPFTPLNFPDSPDFTSQPAQTQLAIAPVNTVTSSSFHHLSGQNLRVSLDDKYLNERNITRESPDLNHPITPEQTISKESVNQQVIPEASNLPFIYVADNTQKISVNSHQEGMAQSSAETSINVPSRISIPSPQLPIVRSPLSPQPVIQHSPEQTTNQIQPQLEATNPEQPPPSSLNPRQSISQNTIPTISESKQTLLTSDRQSSQLEVASSPPTIQPASIAPSSSVVNQAPNKTIDQSPPSLLVNKVTSGEPPAAQSTPVRLPLVSSSELSSQSVASIERSHDGTSTQADMTTTPTSIQPVVNHPSVQGETSITQISNKLTASRGLGTRDWGLGNHGEMATSFIRPTLFQGSPDEISFTTRHKKTSTPLSSKGRDGVAGVRFQDRSSLASSVSVSSPFQRTSDKQIIKPISQKDVETAAIATDKNLAYPPSDSETMGLRHNQAGQSSIKFAHRRGVTISEIQQPPIVQVTIGRIDVRGVKPVAPPPSKPKQSRPTLSLNDYLQQRNGGSP